MMYKAWLYYTCKWATVGLDGVEMPHWQEMTTKLNKHCPDCEEGYSCTTCKNTGLKLTPIEKMIVQGIEMALDGSKVNAVN